MILETIIVVPIWFIVVLVIMSIIFLGLIAMLGSPWGSTACDISKKDEDIW